MPLETGFVIPISVLLIPLGIFLLFYIFYSTFNIYHLLRFGVYNFSLYVIATVFALGSIFLIGLSLFFLLKFDWNAPISFNDFVGTDTELIGL